MMSENDLFICKLVVKRNFLKKKILPKKRDEGRFIRLKLLCAFMKMREKKSSISNAFFLNDALNLRLYLFSSIGNFFMDVHMRKYENIQFVIKTISRRSLSKINNSVTDACLRITVWKCRNISRASKISINFQYRNRY